jgi:hypothetical protein
MIPSKMECMGSKMENTKTVENNKDTQRDKEAHPAEAEGDCGPSNRA